MTATRLTWSVAIISTLTFGALTSLFAQDTTATQRHLLSLDPGRIVPARRTYDMVVQSGDSTINIGEREVTLVPATYAGASAFVLVERRTGAVPAAESLYLALDLRPLHWSSLLGTARLAAEFVGDSIYGATSAASGKHNIVLGARPDLLVGGAMVEAVLAASPLALEWSDSVSILVVDLTSAIARAGELAVLGETELSVDGQPHPCWIVALRIEGSSREVLFWIAKLSGSVLRMQQPLAPHVGTMLEYRLRSEVVIDAVPPPE